MARFTIYKDVAGEFRWRFTANNGKIIAVASESYKNKSDCQTSVQIVKQQAWNALEEEDSSAKDSRGVPPPLWR